MLDIVASTGIDAWVDWLNDRLRGSGWWGGDNGQRPFNTHTHTHTHTHTLTHTYTHARTHAHTCVFARKSECWSCNNTVRALHSWHMILHTAHHPHTLCIKQFLPKRNILWGQLVPMPSPDLTSQSFYLHLSVELGLLEVRYKSKIMLYKSIGNKI